MIDERGVDSGMRPSQRRRRIARDDVTSMDDTPTVIRSGNRKGSSEEASAPAGKCNCHVHVGHT